MAGRRSQLGRMAFQHALHGFAPIADQVSAISYLERLRRSLSSPLGIVTGAVARDDLDAGMIVQPRCQRFRLPVRQKIDRAMLLQIDQDRPVGVSFPLGPVVHSEHSRCGLYWPKTPSVPV